MAEAKSFVGREKELELIKGAVERSQAKIIVVYGRRRIGKSLLIEHALQGKNPIIIDGIENQPKQEQINGFSFQTGIQCGVKSHQPLKMDSWRGAFYHLYEQIKENPRPVVFDEFQWMANYRSEIVADLKLIWDRYFSKIENMTLILCGSIASFMINKVLKSRALYGRIDLEIELQPFTLTETAKICAHRGVQEILDAHLLTSGVPKYLQLLNEKTSVRLGMKEHAFEPSGYFLSEYEKIFISHFGRNPEYEKIIETLAHHPYGLRRTELISHAGIDKGGGLTEHLMNLEVAGFISSQTPFHKKQTSKHKRYFIHDAYLRFYFSFIKPNLGDIKKRINIQRYNQIWSAPTMRNWLGRSFEHLCLQHAELIAANLKFSGINYTCGPLYSPRQDERGGYQIDLVFDRADNVLTICEMKYTASQVGVNVIEETERKVEILRQQFPRKTVLPVLITFKAPTADLQKMAYFAHILRTEDFIQSR